MIWLVLGCSTLIHLLTWTWRSRRNPAADYLEGYRDAIRHVVDLRLAEREVYRVPVGPFDRALHKIVSSLPRA